MPSIVTETPSSIKGIQERINDASDIAFQNNALTVNYTEAHTRVSHEFLISISGTNMTVK